MSLFRQLWLAVILVTLTTFIGSFAVTILGTRSYLEQRLQRENVDSANALARSISQLSKDPATIGVQLSAFFDSGQFERITITSPDGKVIAERVIDRIPRNAPEWFIDLFPVKAEAGQAQISDNRMHFGVIKVVSHDSLAEQALWDETERLLIWYLLAGIISGLIGMQITRTIRQPLATMTSQAGSITERRFLTISEPGIPELRTIARAMNDLVRQLHNRAIQETLHLEALNKRLSHDHLTGLPNRSHFMEKFLESLGGEELPDWQAETPTVGRSEKNGFLFLLHIENLKEINRKLGRSAANGVLREIVATLESISSHVKDRLLGRLEGPDFVVVVPDIENAAEFLNGLSTRLSGLFSTVPDAPELIYHIGAVKYQHGNKPGDILTAADTALASAQGKGVNTWHVFERLSSSGQVTPSGISDWRQIFNSAIAENRIKLSLYPVLNTSRELIHEEGFARLQALPGGGWLDAADFIPIAIRLGLSGSLDLAVAQRAVEHLRSSPGDLAINFSAETISDWSSRNHLTELLRQQPDSLRRRLWIEIPEYGAFRKLESFRDFCSTFRKMGCRIGIEHFGRQAAELHKLADLGLDYIKVDTTFIHEINQKKENQKLLKAVCSLARTLGILVIALGVETEAELKVLARLGVNGVTGKGVRSKT